MAGAVLAACGSSSAAERRTAHHQDRRYRPCGCRDAQHPELDDELHYEGDLATTTALAETLVAPPAIWLFIGGDHPHHSGAFVGANDLIVGAVQVVIEPNAEMREARADALAHRGAKRPTPPVNTSVSKSPSAATKVSNCIAEPAAPIYDAFYSTKVNGTGLGLAIVHGIVTDHGGSIEVDSRPGRTCFRVTLPIEASQIPLRPRDDASTATRDP